MCGRVSQGGTKGEVRRRLKGPIPEGFEPRFNLAPTNPLLTITPDWTLAARRWGLVPSWSKDLAIGAKTFNARGETVAEKPSFRTSFKRRRCLIPVDGFYEWQTEGKTKTPFFISSAQEGEMLVFARLWDSWEGDGSELQTCTIITTEANAFMEDLHHRMPVILAPEAWDTWLAAETAPGDLQALLKPCSAGVLQAWQVASLRGEGPQLCEPFRV